MADAMCHECGMPLEDAGEWHPWLFCLLWKQGVDDPAAHLHELGYERAPDRSVVGALPQNPSVGDAQGDNA